MVLPGLLLIRNTAKQRGPHYYPGLSVQAPGRDIAGLEPDGEKEGREEGGRPGPGAVASRRPAVRHDGKGGTGSPSRGLDAGRLGKRNTDRGRISKAVPGVRRSKMAIDVVELEPGCSAIG